MFATWGPVKDPKSQQDLKKVQDYYTFANSTAKFRTRSSLKENIYKQHSSGEKETKIWLRKLLLATQVGSKGDWFCQESILFSFHVVLHTINFLCAERDDEALPKIIVLRISMKNSDYRSDADEDDESKNKRAVTSCYHVHYRYYFAH